MQDRYLMITQHFPPRAGAAARRLGHLAAQWSQSGPVFVIRRATDKLGSWPSVTRTIHIEANDLRRMAGGGASLSTAVKSRPLIRRLLPLRQSFPFVLLSDDGGPAYRRKAFAAAKELVETDGITTIFSSFRPWSDHLVARRLKKKYPHLHWIADFRDLPVDRVRKDVWWPALQRWWGKRVIKEADEMWAVSAGQREQFAGWHPSIRVKRNALLSLPPAETAPGTDRFTIVYTGSLYADLQSLKPLTDALVSLHDAGRISYEKIQIIYRGKDADLFRRWTSTLPAGLLDIQPPIAPAAAQKMQSSAQILLLLNWSAPGYYGVLTAKLWDYLASGRPILALVNGPGDRELEAIISGAAAGAVFGEQEQEGIEQWLVRQYEAWKVDGTVRHQPHLDHLKTYL